VLASLFKLLWLAAGLCAAQTRLASFSAAEASAFQAATAGRNLATLGVPATLAARLPGLDPSVPLHRLLIAPVALAWAGAPGELAARARGMIEADAKLAMAEGERADAPVRQLQETKGRLALLEDAAHAYEMKDTATLLARARDAVWTRIESGVSEGLAAGAGALGATMADAPVAPQRGIWAALKRHFAEDPPPPLPDTHALRNYRRFKVVDFWSNTAPSTREEIQALRRIKKGEDRKAYLRAEGEKIVAKIQARFGTSTLGFHYNMHGGQGEQYVDKGILATMGDRIANRNQNPWTYDTRKKVFFSRSPGETLYDILDSNRMDAWPLRLRMGYELMIFDLEHTAIVGGLESGAIGLHTRATWNMSYTFDGLPGFPYSAFVVPPIEVFPNIPRKLGFRGRLSRDEETLAAMRVIEAAAMAEERFVPKE